MWSITALINIDQMKKACQPPQLISLIRGLTSSVVLGRPQNIIFAKLDFSSISNLNFTGYSRQKNPVHQTRHFKLEIFKNQVQIDRGSEEAFMLLNTRFWQDAFNLELYVIRTKNDNSFKIEEPCRKQKILLQNTFHLIMYAYTAVIWHELIQFIFFQAFWVRVQWVYTMVWSTMKSWRLMKVQTSNFLNPAGQNFWQTILKPDTIGPILWPG